MPLPLPLEELPEKLRRFGAPDAPGPAKLMAARGLVPVKGGDLVTLLLQLHAGSDPMVRETAAETLSGLPASVLEGAVSDALHPEVLRALVPFVRANPALLGDLAANRATPAEVVVEIAERADERTCERIATDQVRLLEHPEIIEALYKNPQTRMSTADRLVELAARNGVELTGVATFAAHVEAIQNQLIPDEPLEERLPEDELYVHTLARDEDDDPVELDEREGTEEVKKKHLPLAQMLGQLSLAQKVRYTVVGRTAGLAILVRDPNKMVCMAAISSPKMRDGDAARLAASKQVSDDILRYIGNRRDWLGNYEVKKNLVFNPKTPMGISMKFLSHIRPNDLRALARSKNVPASLRTAATQRLQKKNRG